MMAQFDNTQEWQDRTTSIDYNTKLNLYAKNDLNWRMYNNDHWCGVTTNGLAKWTFPMCMSAIDYFTAYICSQNIKIVYSADNLPDEPTDENETKIKDLTTLMTKAAQLKWEKDKMNMILRDCILDGCVGGDYAVYVYWDPTKGKYGDFCTEKVEGLDVLFGNPNNKIVEKQPWIEVLGRDMVSTLKEIARANGATKEEIDTITADADTEYQAGANGKIELDNKGDSGKCNYVIKFYKKKGRVFWNQSTKSCLIRKDVDLGISRYPIAWGNWKTIKNSYHGMPAIEGIIDNQISINQLFAMVSYWMKMSAFGKVIYDGTRLQSWSNKLGEALKAEGDVQGIVMQLQAGNFNAAIIQVIELAIKLTKDFIGANDALTGLVNPEQASGTAIIATGKQAAVPLGGPTANRDQFVEDLALIWGEFYLKKVKNRKLTYKEEGKVVSGEFNAEGIEDIMLNCTVEVGPSTFYSEISGIESLNNLFKENKITPVQYFERMAKFNVIPDCQGLLEDAKAMEEAQAQMAQQQQAIQQQAMQGQQQMQQDQMMQEQQMQEQEAQQAMAFMEQLPEEVQQKIGAMGEQKSLEFINQLMAMQEKDYMKTITEFMRGGGG